MQRHATAVLLLVLTAIGAPCARAGRTILIGPPTATPAGPAASAKLGGSLGYFFPSDEFATQAFVTAAQRHEGPQRDGQRFAFVVSARATASGPLEPVVATIADDGFRAESPLHSWRVADLLVANLPPGQSIAGATGPKLGGERLFLGLNLATAPDTFHPWLYAFNAPRSGGTPTLRASLDLAAGFAGSAEVTDVQFATLPISDSAHAASFYFLGARRSGDCHTLDVGKATYLDDVPSFSANFHAALFEPFSECHTRSARLEVEALDPTDDELRAMVLAGRCKDAPSAAESACIYRIRDQVDSAALDAGFGGDGQVKIQHASGLNMRFWDVATRAGKTYVALGVEGPQAGSYQPIVVRLNANGTLDAGFGANGIVTIPATGLSTNPRTITADLRGNLVVTGETYTASTVRPFAYFHSRTSPSGAPETYAPQHVEYAFPGNANSTFFVHDHAPDGTITFGGTSYGNYPDVATMRPFVGRIEGPPGTTRAIEYFHAGMGHYAVISIPAEVQALDSGAISGWSRTGYWFDVYATEAPGTLGVDRFFSEAFAPKSSHFYTNSPTEFSILQGNPDWKLEGRTFFTLGPVAGKRCPPATRAVKRVYNNGVTGAPNHQYADDADVVAQAVARGGVIETGAADGSFFCSQ